MNEDWKARAEKAEAAHEECLNRRIATEQLTEKLLADLKLTNAELDCVREQSKENTLALGYLLDSYCVHHNDAERKESLNHCPVCAQAELRSIDEVLARRPAIEDLPTRIEKIEKALITAKQASEFEAALSRAVVARWQSAQTELDRAQRRYEAMRTAVLAAEPKCGWWESICYLCWSETECGNIAHKDTCAITLARSDDAGSTLLTREQVLPLAKALVWVAPRADTGKNERWETITNALDHARALGLIE